MKNLEKIIEKYSQLSCNEDNYGVGGGLSDTGKKASNRHEDALNDEGKLTFGKAAAMFKKATGCEVVLINEIFDYSTPNAEWHHAGFLPKQYGGGMKKTYFLNSTEIVEIATNWNDLIEKLNLSKITIKNAIEEEKRLQSRKLDFLQANAKKIERTTKKPEFFFKTAQEMNGKYGWFDSSFKSYNMTEYFSGWAFESQEKLNEFIRIK